MVVLSRYLPHIDPTTDIEALSAPTVSESRCNVLSPALCDLVMRDTWTIILALWASLQLVWVTMLLVVQLVQISRNQTTYENMKRHSLPQAAPIASAVTAALVSGSTSLGPEGAGVLGRPGSNLPPSARQTKGFFGQWKKLLGLDAFMVTASDVSPSAGSRRRQNPFSRGVITNCKDFWLDPAPCFGRRTVGDAMLGGEVVNYARMYEMPLRTRGGRDNGMRYQQLDGEEGGVV